MTVTSCQTFLSDAQDSAELGTQLKAATGISEIVLLGRRHGYDFTAEELMRGSSEFTPRGPAAAPSAGDQVPGARSTAFYHHEYSLDDLPGFDQVARELPHLKVMPPSVDLSRFHAEFREEDLRSTSSSPDDPAYLDWHDRMARVNWRDSADSPRRDFHLVNLDEHVDHPGYENYFAAKTRVVTTLERLFGTEVRFSGSMWYPPSSYRLWHTNENQPGWRMYLVDVDEPYADPGRTSFFRYLHPTTRQIVTLRERPRIVRFFKAEQDPDRLFWHCIVNPTERHRWSFGFVVPEDWAERLGLSARQATR
ncbi:Nif11-like leader peptide family natural product precursor [Streptomyces africanus]|uniref:Nif11-like leader peptide family natural product precursor n=1 Tax=Streptomyces africanus TaxID=231024 RepID=UPI000A382AEC|nr:Nif11-like leader peptide family natural product precursor [Streptomyces africanus]